MLPPEPLQFLENSERMLRPAEDVELLEEPPPPFWDPVLKNHRRKRLALFRHLHKVGMVRLAARGRALARLGIFLVEKKGKAKRRLILDARTINRMFAAPPGVTLCSSEALSRIEIELPDGVEYDSPEGIDIIEEMLVSLGLADVADCFHRFIAPE